MVRNLTIGDRKIGGGCPCFVIAEAGVNHNGSMELARQLVDAAANAGADAVKFQTFDSERILTPYAPKADYQQRTTGTSESQFDMIRRLELSPKDHLELKRYCHEKDILFMSSAFDEQSADLLSELGVPVFKIPSGEITNLPLLGHVARKRKPMIVSTGMAYLSEVESAVRTIEAVNNFDYVLLQCTSNYPADPADANLAAMQTMAIAFGSLVGYSDHTQGIEVSLAAVAIGACVVEKHLTMDRNLPGPDHKASVEPPEFLSLVQGIRIVEAALGSGRKEPALSEANTASAARKSLVAARHIQAGAILTEELITSKRPGTGLPPSMRESLIGRSVRSEIAKDTPITWQMLT